MKLFSSIAIRGWRQFAEVRIDFHPRLTILTGANGAGKTSILHILNRHWGWNIQYVSEPRKKRSEYWSSFWAETLDSSSDKAQPEMHTIGEISYEDRASASLKVPQNVKETFAVTIEPMTALPGVYVPSHRPLYLHQVVQDIPTNVDAREQLFDVYLNEVRNRWSPKARVTSPSFLLKRSLISLATFSYGSETIEPSDEARGTFEGFQNILRQILPAEVGFRRLRIRVPDVILETGSGNFPIDAVSGGISALIDIAWQVYLYSTLQDDFVVVVDEPEAHLHPALQRTILPRLLDAFPRAQFIIATHNPLVIGSTEESAVYVLFFEHGGRVRSRLLDAVNKAGTANELLRDALGLESTSPIWVEATLKEILDRYRDRNLTQGTLEELRTELHRFGLSQFLPKAIDGLKE